MNYIKLKEKGQITIPARVRAQVHALTGDMFEVVVENGNIVLRAQVVTARKSTPRKPKAKSVDIGQWIGAGKGLFKTPAEADAFIRAERDQWE